MRAAGGRTTSVIDHDRPTAVADDDHPTVLLAPREVPAAGPVPVTEAVTPPPRTLRGDLRRVVGGPARRARLLVVVAVLALAVVAPQIARADRATARIDARAVSAERGGAAELRAEVGRAEDAAVAQARRAADRAAEALAARNEQRHRLAALGLNEQTIDAFLAQALADALLVEDERDLTTADVDRQAGEIPQMETCLVTARQAINRAFNTILDPSLSVPGPSELCRALLGG